MSSLRYLPRQSRGKKEKIMSDSSEVIEVCDSDEERGRKDRKKSSVSDGKSVLGKRKRKEKQAARKKKKGHDLSWLTRKSIMPYLDLDQKKAALQLGLSVSTLKRHFYSLNLGRWPLNRKRTIYPNGEKGKLSFILNDEDVDCKTIDSWTMDTLAKYREGS